MITRLQKNPETYKCLNLACVSSDVQSIISDGKMHLESEHEHASQHVHPKDFQ